jgi:hypothetical protein
MNRLPDSRESVQEIALRKGTPMSDPQLDRAYQQLHATAVMILAKSKIDKKPHDPYYGYRNLARFVHEALNTEPVDYDQVYLRLLAAAKAERSALPTLGHMQALMALVWDMTIPPAHECEFAQVCQRVNEALCYEIGMFATDSMKAVAATLHVDLQVQMGYAEEAAAATIAPPEQTAEAPPSESGKEQEGDKAQPPKPFLH